MRITLVISSLARGGAERVMSKLASSWAEQDKEVTLLTFDHGEDPAYPIHHAVTHRSLGLYAPSHHFLQALFRNLKRIPALRRAIRDSRPDVVISFMGSTNVLTLLATWRLGAPIIVSERSDPILYDIGPIWNSLRRLVYRFAGALVCQTSSALARFRTMTKARGRVIPNLVAAPPTSAERDGRQIRNSQGRFLIAMGRLIPEKGFDLLLNAFSRVAMRHPEWSLTIVGDGPLRTELQTQTEILKIRERVHFPGEVAEPFPMLCAADVFVLSSRFEGFPNALCEAMACGLPVVSFDCPSGPSDIIRHGVDGILVPPQDVSALAAAMDRLMSDAQERERLAFRAPEVLMRFSPDKILALWEQLFEELLGQQKVDSRGVRPKTRRSAIM